MDDAFKGPYIVNRSLGKGIYEIQSEDGKVLKQKVNIGRIKVYRKRDLVNQNGNMTKKAKVDEDDDENCVDTENGTKEELKQAKKESKQKERLKQVLKKEKLNQAKEREASKAERRVEAGEGEQGERRIEVERDCKKIEGGKGEGEQAEGRKQAKEKESKEKVHDKSNGMKKKRGNSIKTHQHKYI